MIVYHATKRQFLEDVFEKNIDDVIADAYRSATRRGTGASEVQSWRASLTQMAIVLRDVEIPDNCWVAAEYHVPESGKRIDFMLMGFGADGRSNAILIELKQWSEVQRTSRDAVVRTHLGGSLEDVSHPSYQVMSYATLLAGFNEEVHQRGVTLVPCAYLHNCADESAVRHQFYSAYLDAAPVFLKRDLQKLRAFIKQYIKRGDSAEILIRIETSPIRPSKSLTDSLAKMLRGNREFTLVDDQKVVFENLLAMAQKGTSRKHVAIVDGRPGSGKSLVAIHLLVASAKRGLKCLYVSKNAAPRAVYKHKLVRERFRQVTIDGFFSGSGKFTDAKKDSYDVLIVDEAHRLNEKGGLYGNLGENQIKELINAARCTIMFVDDRQQVTLKDIGNRAAIEHWAGVLGAQPKPFKLESQFRCNGSQTLVPWIENTLDIEKSPIDLFDTSEFDFRVLDSPAELHALIEEKNRAANKARVVAGYCWNWVSKRNNGRFDIEMPEFDYRRQWNLESDGSLWAVAEESVAEVGCIHTSQGLDLDYVGVIVGPDLVVRDGRVTCRPEKRASTDKSLAGWKKLMRVDPEATRQRVEQLIKNTYRALMTRAMKGCYLYCTDSETAAYFRSRLLPPKIAPIRTSVDLRLPFEPLEEASIVRYVNALPVVDLTAVSAAFGKDGGFEPTKAVWVKKPEWIIAQPDLFIARVLSESLNRRIPKGAWCLFRANPPATDEDRIVIARHHGIRDPGMSDSFALRVHTRHAHRVVSLWPDSSEARFQSITILDNAADRVRIVAECLAVLKSGFDK